MFLCTSAAVKTGALGWVWLSGSKRAVSWAGPAGMCWANCAWSTIPGAGAICGPETTVPAGWTKGPSGSKTACRLLGSWTTDSDSFWLSASSSAVGMTGIGPRGSSITLRPAAICCSSAALAWARRDGGIEAAGTAARASGLAATGGRLATGLPASGGKGGTWAAEATT